MVAASTKDYWLATAADPSQARDFFPWWNPELDAEFYRNRALVRLWCDFPWRAPLTETEGELADQISNDLASAFKLDPAAEFKRTLSLEREWKTKDLGVAAFVQDFSSGEILQATALAVCSKE